MARRYEQLIDLVRQVKPKVIVEIGVHKGLRSAMMCREALKFQETVEYFGFDVFGTEDEAFHEAALNGKGMPSEEQAARRLEEIGPALKWQFIKGDTRKTLHGQTREADLVFIDGDHRLEVIRGDFAAFKDSKCIVLDDQYTGNVQQIDLKVHGANGLVADLQAQGRCVEVLPVRDATVFGPYTQLAVVWP